MFFVYILRCVDGTLYTGYTTDIERRLRAHQRGVAAKYTRTRLPVQLCYTETCVDKSTALKREWEIKHLPRSHKQALIETAAGQRAGGLQPP